MLGVMCLVALLKLVCLFLLVLSVLVFSAYRLCVLMCAENTRTDNTNRNKHTNFNKVTKHITLSIHLYIL